MRSDDDVEARMRELEEELERESAAATRALAEAREAEPSDEDTPPGEPAAAPEVDDEVPAPEAAPDRGDEEDAPPRPARRKKRRKKKLGEKAQEAAAEAAARIQQEAQQVAGEIATESVRSGEGVGSTALTVVRRRLPSLRGLTPGGTAMTVVALGLGGLILWKLIAPIVLAPIMMFLGILGFGLKVGLIGGGLYGGYRIYRWASEDDGENAEE